MNYPNYPPQAPPQQPYPQQGYPPQAQPPYPPAPPQQGYPQPYPPQPYPYPQQVPQQQQAPPQPQRHTTFADVYGQPASGEGQSIARFLHSQTGQTFYGTVTRALGEPDTYLLDRPNFDGRERFGIRIPFFTPLAAFADGRAVWWCSGTDLTNLNNQMAAAGVPLTDVGNGVMGRVPEEGAQISITWTGDTPMNSTGRPMNPRHDHRIIYQRPGTANGQPPPQAADVITPQQWQQPPGGLQPGQQPAMAYDPSQPGNPGFQSPPQPPYAQAPQGMPPSYYTGDPQDDQTHPGVMTLPIPPGYQQPAQAAPPAPPQQPYTAASPAVPPAPPAYPQQQQQQQHPVTAAIKQATQAAEAARDANPPQPVPPQMPQGAPVQALQPPQPLDPAAAQSLANTIRQPVYASDGTIARPPQ